MQKQNIIRNKKGGDSCLAFYKRKKGKDQGELYTSFSLIGILLLVIFLLVGTKLFLNRIQEKVEYEGHNTLRLVSSESAKVFQESLQSRVDYLNSLWIQMKADAGADHYYKDIILSMQSRSEIYGFDRVGFIDVSGYGYNSLGNYVNLADEVRKQEDTQEPITLERRKAVTQEGEEEDIIVLSVLVYGDNKKREGVLYQAFTMESFKQLLNTETFDGNCEAFLMETDGTVLAATRGFLFEYNDNVFYSLEKHDARNKEFGEQISQSLKSEQPGFGKYIFEGDEQFCAYAPISIRSGEETKTFWFAGVIPQSVMDEQTWDIVVDTFFMMFVVGVFVVALCILIYCQQHRSNRELKKLAYQDLLTGVDNFEAFKQNFQSQKDKKGVLITFDLINFKLINRYFGVETGNKVLEELAKLFSEMCPGDAFSARVSDDQFLFFYPKITTDEAMEKCRELNDRISKCLQKFQIIEAKPVFGCCATDDTKPVERFRDKAAFSKSIARRTDQLCCVYDEKAAQEHMENMRLLNTFEMAIEKEEFEIWYQPKYLVREKRVGGAEALIRWREDDGKLISPGRFLPLLEEHNRVAILDEYVFKKVCRYQKRQIDEGRPWVPISVNVSRRGLIDPELPDRYYRILKETGAKQSCVLLEITEDVVQGEVIEAIKELRRKGFFVLMDDFGQGHSNLANLRRDLFDGIKFDKSLIDLIGIQSREIVVSSTMQMVQKLGMRIIAEGVECQEQADYLEKLGCDEIQSFFYYRPVSEDEFTEIVRSSEAVDN